MFIASITTPHHAGPEEVGGVVETLRSRVKELKLKGVSVEWQGVGHDIVILAENWPVLFHAIPLLNSEDVIPPEWEWCEIRFFVRTYHRPKA